MPTNISPEQIQRVDLDNEPFKVSLDGINEAYALTLVNETFYQYETFRAQYSDPRWNISDSLYYGWLPAKTWEGTTIPRSSLGMQIVFDQIEASLPAISQEIFAPQDEWFQVETEPGADIKEARGVQEHLSYVLEHSKNDWGLSAKNEIELAFKSTLLYGNGGISVEYDSLLKRPVVQWVDTRDFYIDPGCPVPSIDESRSVIRRKMLTVDELISRRSDPRMKIPSDGVLYNMSMNPLFAVGDQTKRNAEAIRGVSYTPGVSDYAINPAERKIEVLMYYSNARIIWVLNREAVIYNEKNPYGFIPFCFAPCYTVPGRFYAQSIADVQEGNQRYIEALLNGRLDAVTLELQPPRIYKSGVLMTPAQLKWRPGAMYQANDPKDMSLLQPQTQMSNVFSEIAFIKSAAEERTGVNSAMSGIPKPSNTNRTATGVNAIASGSMSRLRYLVANFENYLIVPLLYKLYTIVQKHTLPNSPLTGITDKGGLSQVNSNAFRGPMRFRMLASSRMMTREKLAQVFPFLTQYMMNGTFLAGLQKEGKTIDFAELFLMLRDATGTGRLYNFIRPMTQQEQQQASAPPPEAQMQMQQAQSDQQLRLQISREKNQTAVQTTQIANQPQPPPPPNPQELEQEQQTHAMEMEREAARLKSEQMLAQIKVASEVQKNQANMEAKRQELAFKQQDSAQSLHASMLEHTMNLQQNQQNNEIQQAQNQQGLVHAQDTHEQMLKQMKEKSAQGGKIRKKAETRKKEKGPSA